jgi:hypothetical protein
MSAHPSFSNFKEIIACHEFVDGDPLPATLTLWLGKSGKHKIYYAPFEHRNVEPKVALIGITPGRTQAIKALCAAKTALNRGFSDEQCLLAAKLYASFGGDMRDDLVSMLDLLGIHKLIGEASTASLWTVEGYPKAHFCSLLSFPTFEDEKNYNGVPRIKESEAFRSMLEATAKSLNALPPDTLVLPLGAQVAKALMVLRKARLLNRELLAVDNQPIYVPHPSPQNVESIGLLLNWQHNHTHEYAEVRHAQYLRDKPWLRKCGKKQQTPEAYKACRVRRWQAVYRLRRNFGVI